VIGGLVPVALASYSSLGLALGNMSVIGAALVFLFVRNSTADRSLKTSTAKEYVS
jgi:hypothetical protein